jgi:hypothetical protein
LDWRLGMAVSESGVLGVELGSMLTCAGLAPLRI